MSGGASMQTAYHIDILARIGIISLLPLGLHMGHIWGVQPYGGWFLVAMWALSPVLAGTLHFSLFLSRDRPRYPTHDDRRRSGSC